MRVIWAPVALTDIQTIHGYIAAFNPTAADRLAQRLLDAGYALGRFPDRGRPLAGGRRELLVIWPYAIRYRIRDGEVEVMRVRHGRQRPSPTA